MTTPTDLNFFTPALMWGYGLLLTMVVVVKEELYGYYHTKDVLLFSLAYGGYVLVPIMVMLRVVRTPVFSTTSPSSESNGRPKQKQH